MNKAHKIRIYPNQEQQDQILRTFGCVRFYWNFLLDQKIKNYEGKKKDPNFEPDTTNYAQLKKREEYSWLKEVEAQPLCQVARDLNRSFNLTFKSGFGFPKFKSKKRSRRSYRTSGWVKVNNNYVHIPRVGWVRMAENLRFEGKINSLTVSQTRSGIFFASFSMEVENNILPKNDKKIGLDLGLSNFCVASNGDKIDAPHYYRNLESKLKKAQRKLSRQILRAKKDNRNLDECKNFQKQRIKVAKIHEKIANQRNDFLHKLSSKLTDENQIICIEDLNVKGLLQNHNLSKSIKDVSWFEFTQQLFYKAKWKGRTVIKVDRFFPSSQICSNCGHHDGKKELKIREWICPECGSSLDRDVNAAINILNEGLRLI